MYLIHIKVVECNSLILADTNGSDSDLDCSRRFPWN